MNTVDDIFTAYAKTFEAHREAEISLADYLDACKKDPLVYSTATERLLAAIGEPEMVDTSKDPRLGRILMNRTIRIYPAFSEYYGMEETIERILGSRFRVQKLVPSRLRQIGTAKTEPGDENNQDISSLVGKVDIRKLEMHAQNDFDAYRYSGGLNRANQGMLGFVEMFDRTGPPLPTNWV